MNETTYAEFLKSGVGAFAGAFFAFLFLRLAEWLKSLHDRKVRHYDALLKLEYQGNMLLDAIACNLYDIDQIILSVEESQKTGDIMIPGNRPVPFEFDDGVLYDLANLDMVNEVLYYKCKIKRLNGDIANLVAGQDLFTRALLEGKLTKENYMRDSANCVSKFSLLRAHLSAFEAKTKRLVAESVVRASRDRSFWRRHLSFSIRRQHERSFEATVTKHLAQLDKDIQMVEERSRKEIEQAQSE